MKSISLCVHVCISDEYLRFLMKYPDLLSGLFDLDLQRFKGSVFVACLRWFTLSMKNKAQLNFCFLKWHDKVEYFLMKSGYHLIPLAWGGGSWCLAYVYGECDNPLDLEHMLTRFIFTLDFLSFRFETKRTKFHVEKNI